MKVSVSISDPTQSTTLAMVQSAGGLPCIEFEYDCDGGTETLTVCQNPGESDSDFVDRAYADLAEALEACGDQGSTPSWHERAPAGLATGGGFVVGGFAPP